MDHEKQKIDKLKDVLNIQCTNGNWNYNQYMHGFVNGLILASSIMSETEPVFFESPIAWLKDT